MSWTQDLAIGVREIDEQHKKLFEMAEQLFEAGKNRKAKEFIGELLDFLGDYTKRHFKDEEGYMLKINYPDYAVQKKQHDDFIAKVASLKKEYTASGGNLLVILNANQMVLNWLVNHISKEDKKIGQFAKTLKL
jgi:hemerythrin